MSVKKFLIAFIIPVVCLFSCQTSEDELPTGDFDFYITGFKSGLSVDFSAGSRTDQSTPDDVHQLHVQILDGENQVVYEQYYWDYDDYYYYDDDSVYHNEDSLNNTQGRLAREMDFIYSEGIPDTIFIPSLPAGDYHVLAATTYIGNYYYYYDYATADSSDNYYYNNEPRIDTYAVNDGPIYVGKESLYLSEEEQEVLLDMNNVSAKITVTNASDATNVSGWADLMVETQNNQYYSFLDESLFPSDYDYDAPVYTYLDPGGTRDFYVLPRTLTGLTLNYWDYYSGASFSSTLELDPNIELGIGDAVTFTVDLEEILSGAGSGSFDWEEIDWNDLGEVTVP